MRRLALMLLLGFAGCGGHQTYGVHGGGPVIEPVSTPVDISPPTIGGQHFATAILTASPGTWTQTPTYTYRWRRCNEAGGSCSNIEGATSSTYTLATEDIAHTVTVEVTATNTHGSATATSAATAVVTALVSGESQAVCSPSPCTSGTSTNFTLENVSNDNETSETRAYQVFRPGHLAASSANRAPAFLVFGGSGACGVDLEGRWRELALTERNIVVNMEVPCGRNGSPNWNKKWVTAASETKPDDQPYVRAVVNAITECPGSPNAGQCVDPKRIYAVGTSSGGNMAADIMCDPTSSSLFRGYEIDSSSVQLYGGKPDCPGTNENYFVMLNLSNAGIDAGLYNGTLTNPHYNVPEFADWMKTKLGCPGSRVDDTIGTPEALNPRYSYKAPCTFAQTGRAVETMGVINGGHEWQCQDSDPASPADVSGKCAGLLETASPPGPGLTEGAKGRPKTNGLFVEQAFETFVDEGNS